jgi:hypothetical protein
MIHDHREVARERDLASGAKARNPDRERIFRDSSALMNVAISKFANDSAGRVFRASCFRR